MFVIFVLLTANFQSPRMALISIGAVPGVLAGIAMILYFTNTSLNIESFMGSIMSLGVSVSNSVLLVTFMNEHWKEGATSVDAAVVGAGERLRPILMTACAMTVGMVPMALALERGSQMQAPLGLAVIGGLVMSTFATLLVLPSIFVVVIGNKLARSPSIYPDDPKSTFFDPHVFAGAGGQAARHSNGAQQTPLRAESAGVPRGRPRPRACRALSKRGCRKRSGESRQVRIYGDARCGLYPAMFLRKNSYARHGGTAAPDAPRLLRKFSPRSIGRGRLGCTFLAALSTLGCGHEATIDFTTAQKPPVFHVINPSVRNIVRIVGQPSFIEAYERTSIYPKLTAYIKEWKVDIGDKVKKDQPLAYLYVPELEEDHKTKEATVELDKERVELARKIVEVAAADVTAAAAASPNPRPSSTNTRPTSTAGIRRSSG